MAGHKPFSELAAKMPPERQSRAKARTKEMLAEMLLSDARQFVGITQKEIYDGTCHDASLQANKHQSGWGNRR